MATSNKNKQKTQMVRLVAKLTTADWQSTQLAVQRVVRTAPDQVDLAIRKMKEVAGRKSATSQAAAKEFIYPKRLSSPRLPFPTPRGKPVPEASLPGARLAAAAISSAVGQEFMSVIDHVRSGGKYEKLVKDLGIREPTEWVALFRGALTWAPLTGKQLAGQRANLAGQLFQRIRKSAPAFADVGEESARIVAAFNRLQERRLLGSSGGGASGASELRDLVYGNAVFYENIVDGERKLLSDGMYLAFNAKKQVLITAIDEVKLESVAQEVFGQFDHVLARIRTRGMWVNKEYIHPSRIELPVFEPGRQQPLLSAFLENAKRGPTKTPRGYAVQRVPVPSAEVRDFVKEVLSEWRRRLMTTR